MQHKSLFAAMMVGALVLASCVKNQESQSVTDVRTARADEIKSQAELNRANAEAAVTLAKAQAAIAAAQAELLKAQQAIVEAEAAKLQVEAELAAVEVEIAKVKLEGERVKLQAKKAELEALIAKYEADIAKYAVEKEKALNDLAKAEMQAEIDEITMQKKLIDEQTALMKSIAAFGIEKEIEVNALWALYSQAVKDLSAAQTELIHKQVQLAKLEAGEETSMDILLEKITAKQTEIEAQEFLIEELESVVEVDAATIKASMEAARSAYSQALTKKEQAIKEAQILIAELQTRENLKFEYEQDWRAEFNTAVEGWQSVRDSRLISWFEGLLDDEGCYISDGKLVFQKIEMENPETGREEAGIVFFYQSSNEISHKIPHYDFIPLYTANTTDPDTSGDRFLKVEEDFVYNPVEDGVVKNYAWNLKEVSYVPAKIYTENFANLIEFIAEIEAAEFEGVVNKAMADHAEMDSYIDARMEALEAEMAEREEYVTAAGEEVKAAYLAIATAKAEAAEAEVALDVATQNYLEYSRSKEFPAAVKEEARALDASMSAFEALERAQERVDKLHTEIFGVANASDATPNDEDEVIIGLLSQEKALEQAAFESGKIAAEKHAATVAADKARTEHVALKEAWNDAKAALKDKEDKVRAAKKDEQEKLEKYHKAVIVYTAEPTDTNEKAMKEAETAYNTAKNTVTTLEADIPELETKVANTHDAWFEYETPYQQAVAAEALAKVGAEADYEAWQKVKTALENVFVRYHEAVTALGDPDDDDTKDTAFGRYKACMERLEEAIAAVGDNSDPTLLELRVAWHNAMNDSREARAKIRSANRDLALLIGDPDGKIANPKYPDFVENLAHLYPIEGEEYFADVYEWILTPYMKEATYMPGQNYAQYVWYGEMKEVIAEVAQDRAFPEGLEKLTEKYLNLESEVLRFAEAEEDYVTFIEGMQEMAEEVLACMIAARDAEIEFYAPDAAYRALQAYLAATVYTDGKGSLNIVGFETYIENAKKKLIGLQVELAELKAQLIAGVEIKLPGQEKPEYLQVMIGQLEAEIQALMAEIEVLTAKIEGYIEELSRLLSDIE